MEDNTLSPHTASSEHPAAMFAQHAQVDTHAERVVNRYEATQAYTTLVLLALFALPILFGFFSSWIKTGFGTALLNLVIAGFVAMIVFACINWVLDKFVFLPWRAIQYRLCANKMGEAVPSFGLQPAMQYQWHNPNPGVIALDSQHGVLYINARSGGYERLFLAGRDILEAKVERESEIHTNTTHSGSVSVFSSAGIGYNSGSTSKSTSVVHESAFLEIHYQRPQDGAPNWVAIPFGENRRDADSMLAAIKRLQNASQAVENL